MLIFMYTSICENIQPSLRVRLKVISLIKGRHLEVRTDMILSKPEDLPNTPPAPMNHVKNLRAGPSKMTPRCWYICGTNHFDQADFCLAEMKKPTMLSNKSITAWSCAENQIFVRFLRIKSSEQDFKYLYWRISKILLWHLFTWKGIYMIDWVGRLTVIKNCKRYKE